MTTEFQRKPNWLKIKLPDLKESANVIGILGKNAVNTICSSGMCPNRGECWGHGTATFMLGGDTCTRACRFCVVKTGNPHGKINKDEVIKIAETVKSLNLKHVVLTSVDRDDLADGGADHWTQVIGKIKEQCPNVTIEALIPDFLGNPLCLDMIVEAGPDVISHNMETVKRLTPAVRSVATYERSLGVIRHVSKSGIRSKSGLMLGLGESLNEVLATMDDLIEAGCKVLTVGQYLRPNLKCLPVEKYWTPDEFELIREEALNKGFQYVESGPFVRSSFHAERHVK